MKAYPGLLVTAGCQEALYLCATELCREPNDIVLVHNPTYIGITGVADSQRITITVFNRADRADVGALAETLDALDAAGQRARMLIWPRTTVSVLAHMHREAIIALCAARCVVTLEDNPYDLFAFEAERLPSMRALDRHGCVIYLVTYSKTLCQGLRVDFAVLAPTLFGDASAADALQQALTQRKSFDTLKNTGQICRPSSVGSCSNTAAAWRH